MRKTPAAARFTRQLISANDQVCFSALREWEFELELNTLVQTRPNDFTTVVFAANPYAEAIYRKMSDLRSFANEAQQVGLRMGIIAAVEYSLAYLEEVQKFRRDLIPSEADEVRNDAEEEQLLQKLKRWSDQAPTKGYFWTMGYMRLLRNHYAHLNSEIHLAMRSYIQSYGTPLNKFWNNGITDIHGIDFNTLPNRPLTPKLTFGVMNLLRVSVQHIDNMVAETFPLTATARFCLDEIFESPNNRVLPPERIASKLRARLASEWAVNVSKQAAIHEVIQLTSSRT